MNCAKDPKETAVTTGRLAVGVDLGGTKVRAAVVDPSGDLRASAKERVDQDRRPAAVVETIVACIERVLAEAGSSIPELAGIGVGVAAQMRGESGVVAVAPNLGWREVAFGDMLSSRLGRQVRVINDLDAIAWGETCFGAARGHKNCLVVYCGTGVGGGFVLGGRPYHGSSGVAGEIGHVKVRPEEGGSPCGCGQRGCLEAYLGGKNLSERLRAEAQADWPELMAEAGGDVQAIHPGLVEHLAKRGDERALALWDELAAMLADVLANAVTLLNLSALVLGGTVLYGCPSLHERVRQAIAARVLAVSAEALSVLDDQLGDRAGILGAAVLQWEASE